MFSKLKKFGYSLAFLMIISMLFAGFTFSKQEKFAFASDETNSEISLQIEGEISNISAEVDYTKTNENGVPGIYTSMGVQDLIDGEYLRVTVEYTSGESEVITSGYELSMGADFFSAGNVNEVMVEYGGKSTTVLVNATLVQISTLDINTDLLEETDIYENFSVNDLNEYITVTGVNNDGSLYNEGSVIPFAETSDNGEGYTLQGPSSGTLTAGSNTITVSYQNATGSFSVSAIARVIESITAVFDQGENIIYSTETMLSLKNYTTVTAQYNDGTSAEVNIRDYTISGDLFTTAGELETPTVTRVLTVTLNANEEIFDNVNVEVTPDIPTRVEVENYNPYYYALEEFDIEGASVRVSFEHGSSRTVTDNYYVIYNEEDNRLHVSDRYVTIGYMENGIEVTTELEVYVEAQTIEKVSISTIEFTYAVDKTHTVTINNYQQNLMTIQMDYPDLDIDIDETKGTVSVTNAGVGEYTIKVVLNSDYVWVDGSSDPIELRFNILPASFSSSVSIISWDYGDDPNSPNVTYNPGNVEEGSIIYYYYGTSYDGTYNHSRGDENTIVPTVAGEYRVYAYIPAGGNYGETITSDTLFYVRVANNQITASNYEWEYDEANKNKINPTFDTYFDLITNYTISYYQEDDLLGSNSYTSDGTYQGTSEYYPQNVGSYTVRIQVAGTQNYNAVSYDITLTITRKPVENNPTMNTTNLVFAGSADKGNSQEKVLSNYDENKMTFTFASSDGQEYSTSETNGAYYVVSGNTITFYATNVIKDSGSYTVTLKIGSNYAWQDGSSTDLVFSYQITQAQNQIEITNEDEFSAGWTYTETGLQIVPEVSALFYQTGEPTIEFYLANGDDLGEKLTSQPNDAGTYFVVVSVQETDNYSSASAQAKFEIGKKEIAIPSLDHSSDTYNTQQLTNSISNYDSVSMSVDVDNTTVQYNIAENIINLYETNAGEYQLVLKLNSSNYVWADDSSENKTFSWTIEKASLAKPTQEATTTFLGGQQSIELSEYGVTSEMSVTVSTEMQGKGLSVSDYTLSATDAITYTATISILDTDNYKWQGDSDDTLAEDLTFSWTINKVQLQVEWTQTTFVYTGSNITPTYTISGWVGSDSNESNGTYTIVISGGKTNVGNQYLATLDLTRKNGGNENYTLSSTQTYFEITKASLFVTFTDTELVYNGQEQGPTYEVTSFLVPNEVNTYSFVFTQTGKDVGDYSTELTLTSNNEIMNYELYLASGSNKAETEFSISPASLQVEWQDLEFEYDGEEKIPTAVISGWFNLDSELYDTNVTVAEGSATNAGIYNANLSITPKDETGKINYTLQDTDTEFEILKRKIDVSKIVSEPENIEGNTNLTDRRIPFSDQAIKLEIASSPDLYRLDINPYLNEEFEPIDESEIVSVGTYYMVLQLVDDKNNEWYNYNQNDQLVENNQIIRLWFEITLAQFDMQLSIPELDEGNEIVYGTEYSFTIGNNPNNANYSAEYYSVLDGSQTKLDNQPTDAGEYILRVTIEASADYDRMIAEIRYTITKRVLTVTISVSNGVYGEWQSAKITDENISNLADEGYSQVSAENFTFNYTSKDGEYNSGVAPKDVGQYSVEALLDDKNYMIETTTADFEITKATLNISINPVDINYGDEDPTRFYTGSSHISYTQSELKHEDTIDNLGINFIYESTYTQGNSVGTYYIYLDNGQEEVEQNETQSISLKNYNLNVTRGVLTVDKRQITANVVINESFVYDGENIEGATATANNLYNSDQIEFVYNYEGIDGTQYTASETAPINAGKYQVIVTIKPDTQAYTNYELANTSAEFEITRASLTINITDATITYGDADPTQGYKDSTHITYAEDQLQGTDTIDSIGLDFTYSSNYDAGDDALGQYYIYLSSYGEQEVAKADIQNYTLTINAGELTVNKKTITATIDVDGQTFEYDGNNIYLGEQAGAVATPDLDSSFAGEQVEFVYTYSGILETEYDSTTVAPIDVGSYKVVVNLGSASENNYIFNSISAFFSISKKKVDVIWQSSDSFTYNGLDQSINGGIVAKYTPATDDEDNDGILNIAITLGESEFKNAGSYTFTASLESEIELKNYELVNNITKVFEIQKATISSINWNYADENFTYNGLDQREGKVFATFVGVESDSSNHNLDLDSIKQNDLDVEFVDAGSYQIYIKLNEADEKNYKFADALDTYRTYVIENADIIVSGQVVGYSAVYDAQEHDVATTLPELTYVESAGTPEWKFRIKTDNDSNEYTSTLKLKNVGEYTIEYIVELDNHNNTTGEFSVSITKKYLVLTATTTIQFGNNITQHLEDYTISAVEGNKFAGDEDVSVLSGVAQFSTDNYVAGTDGIGRYNLTIQGFSSNNYDISYETGEIVVIPRKIVVNITPIKITYGEGWTEFPIKYSNISSGALEGVEPADIYSLAVYSGEDPVVLVADLDVGEYDVRPINVNENYEIIEVLNGEKAYTISQREISIAITNSSHEYNGQRQGVTAKIQDTDVDLDIQILYSSEDYYGKDGTEIAPWQVGKYKVEAQIVDENAGNYLITYTATAELNITPRIISIVISDQSAPYTGKEPILSNEMGSSESDPKDWYINSTLGLCQNVTGEMDDLGVTLSIPEGSINAGSYTISLEHTNQNYEIRSTVSGKFTIEKVDLTITIQDQTITYGNNHDVFELKYAGFIEGENENTEGMFIGGTPTATTEYQPGDSVDSYQSTFTSKDISSTNYNIEFVDGTIQVIAREISITILDQEAFYTGSKPEVSSEMGVGWQVTSEQQIYNNDDLKVVLTIESVEKYDVGQYDINHSYDNSNYYVTWVEGSNIDAFTINKVELQVIADDISIQYGNSPVNTYSIEGFVNNETDSLIEGLNKISFNNIGYDTTLGVDTPAGEISLNGIENLTAKNYSFKAVSGKWTIIQRNIDLEADSSNFYQGQTNVYGEFDVDTPINPAKAKVVANGLVGTDSAGDSGDVDVLFKYTYFGESYDGTWNYPAQEAGSTTYPTRAGTYTVVVTITSKNYKINSESESVSFVYTILKHRVSTPSWETASFKATGDEYTNTLYYEARYSSVFTSSHPITNDNNGTVTMTASDGGEYSVTLALIDANNYTWSSATGDNPRATISWTISQNNDNTFTEEITMWVNGEAVETIVKDDKTWFDHTWTYGDDFNNPSAEALYGEVEFEYYYAGSGEAVGAIPTDAGNYYVKAIVVGTADWNGLDSGAIYFTIQQKKLTIPTIEDETYQDGSVIKKLVNDYLPDYMQTLGSNVELVYDAGNLYLQASNVHQSGYYVNIALTDSKNYIWNDDSSNAIRLEWNILPKQIEKPVLNTQSYEYDGSIQQYALSNQDLNKYYSIISDATATNVGNYTVVVALIDKINYCWADSSTDNLSQTWTITAKQVSLPTISNTTYNHGEVISVLIENYDNSVLAIESTGSAFVITGEVRSNVQYYINAVDTGDYTIVFALRDSANYDFVAPFADDDTIEVIWKIAPYSVAKPTFVQDKTYTYNGSQIVYEITDSLDSEYYSVTGNTGIDADEYTVQISLVNSQNYVWAGGGLDPLVQSWEIVPASDNEITISNEDVLLDGWVYGEQFVAPIASDTYGGTISITYYEIGEDGDSLLEDYPTNAGSYYAVISSSNDKNNFNTDSETVYFTIRKATITITPFDIEINYGDELPNVQYSVEGLIGEDSIENLDNIALVCDYDLNTSENRKVGQYPITFTGLDMRNYEFNYGTATLTVVKKDITVTLTDQNSIYNGQEPNVNQTAYTLNPSLSFTSDSLNIIISKANGVNAGDYQLTASAENSNYNITIVDATFTIERATISANEIEFNDMTFISDGNVHSLQLSGNIPAGMSVEYENNYASLPGVYQVTARLIYNELNYTYSGEDEFTATMTINASEMKVEGDYRQDKLILSSDSGFNPNYELTVNDITDYEFSENELANYSDPKFSVGYDINLLNDEVEVELNEAINISLLLPENLKGTNFVLLQNQNGTNVELQYELLGNYVVFETDDLGDILLVEIGADTSDSQDENDMTWLIIVLTMALILIMIWFIFTIVKARKLAKGNNDIDFDNDDDDQISKNKKSNTTKMNSIIFSPMLLAVIPKSQLIGIIILSIVCVAMLIATIVIHIKNVKVKESIKNDFIYADEAKIFGDDELDEESVQESSNLPFNFGNKRFRSFRTKLKQADQETKDRYKEFINYSKTIPNVKNSISKKQVRLYKGRKTVTIVFFRGKTICMAFPLDPKIYENTKYKGIDASSVKRFENTPMLIKLTSNRRLETAKYLLLQSI